MINSANCKNYLASFVREKSHYLQKSLGFVFFSRTGKKGRFKNAIERF